MRKEKTIIQLDGQDVYFSPNGTISYRVLTNNRPEGYVDMESKFRDFDDVRGHSYQERLSLLRFYEEIFPESIKDGKFIPEYILNMFPGTEFTFKLEPKEYIYQCTPEEIEYYKQFNLSGIEEGIRQPIVFDKEPKKDILDTKIQNKKNNKGIIQKNKEGVIINNFMTPREAQKATGIDSKNIYHCIMGKRKSAGGFIWENN